MPGVEISDSIAVKARAIWEYLSTLEPHHIYGLIEVTDVDYDEMAQTKDVIELAMSDSDVAKLKVCEKLSIPLQKALELARKYHR